MMHLKSWQHISFWVLVFTLLILILSDWFESFIDAFLYLSYLFPVIIGTSYFFTFFLVQRYLFTRRFGHFLLYTFYMLVVSLCLEMLAGIFAFLTAVHFGINDMGILITDIFTLGGLLYFVVLLFSFLLLVRHYYLDQRALLRLHEKQELAEQGWLSVRSERQNIRVQLDEIQYIESLSDYVRIYLVNGEQLDSKVKISHMENKLPKSFLRIHRSFLVNSSVLSSFKRDHVLIGETELPMSRTYGQKAYEFLRHKKEEEI